MFLSFITHSNNHVEQNIVIYIEINVCLSASLVENHRQVIPTVFAEL